MMDKLMLLWTSCGSELRELLIPLLLLLSNLVIFGRTLWYDMVIDDNCRKFHVKDLHPNWFIRMIRTTMYSGYGGLPIWIDHLVTVLLHTITCIIMYKTFGCLAAVLLFAIHPANNQVSVWLNGKRAAMITILTLLAWWLKPYGAILLLATPLWNYGALPGLLLFPNMLGLIFLTSLLFYRQIINKFGTRWETIPPGEIKTIRWKKLVVFIKMLGYHIAHCVFPRRMSFYHMFMERFGFSDEDNDYWYSFNKDFWWGLVLTGGLVTAIIMNWGNPIGFGLSWWLLFISPWCGFPVGVTQAVSGRTYYLPNVGLCLALGSAFPHSVLLALYVYYITKLWFYMPAYRNVEEFYRYALAEFPDHFRARSHVIKNNLGDNKVFFALRDAGLGLRHHPKDCTLNMLMCQSLMTIGAWDKALEYAGKAKKCIVPGHEKKLLEVIENFEKIIKDIKTKGYSPKRIQPGEVVKVKASQIAGGQ